MLARGQRVVDLGCWPGGWLQVAAAAVGPTGRVVGVDLSARLLELGRDKAARSGLANLEFVEGDMTSTGFPDGSFDRVICVFGISFAPDMEAFAAELWRMVRPGGRLAITSWGPRLWAPMYDVWRTAVRAERPDLVSDFHPWDRITMPASLVRLLSDAGIPRDAVRVLPEFDVWPLRSAHDWWSIVMGTGLRWTMDQLTPEAGARVRAVNLDYARRQDVASVTCNVLYATATKPLDAANPNAA